MSFILFFYSSANNKVVLWPFTRWARTRTISCLDFRVPPGGTSQPPPCANTVLMSAGSCGYDAGRQCYRDGTQNVSQLPAKNLCQTIRW